MCLTGEFARRKACPIEFAEELDEPNYILARRVSKLSRQIPAGDIGTFDRPNMPYAFYRPFTFYNYLTHFYNCLTAIDSEVDAIHYAIAIHNSSQLGFWDPGVFSLIFLNSHVTPTATCNTYMLDKLGTSFWRIKNSYPKLLSLQKIQTKHCQNSPAFSSDKGCLRFIVSYCTKGCTLLKRISVSQVRCLDHKWVGKNSRKEKDKKVELYSGESWLLQVLVPCNYPNFFSAVRGYCQSWHY